MRKNSKIETRHKLLGSAAACFAKKGFSGCSVSDIVSMAGVSQGNLYVHFKSKDDLFKTIIQDEFAAAVIKLRNAANASPSLQTIITIFKECVLDQQFPMDHRLWVEILATASRDPEVRKTFALCDRELRDAFISLLREAAKAGEIDSGLDFEAVSVWAYALADGLIARSADDENFDLNKHLPWFEKMLRRALLPEASKGAK